MVKRPISVSDNWLFKCAFRYFSIYFFCVLCGCEGRKFLRKVNFGNNVRSYLCVKGREMSIFPFKELHIIQKKVLMKIAHLNSEMAI